MKAEKSTFRGELSFQRSECTAGLTVATIFVFWFKYYFMETVWKNIKLDKMTPHFNFKLKISADLFGSLIQPNCHLKIFKNSGSEMCCLLRWHIVFLLRFILIFVLLGSARHLYVVRIYGAICLLIQKYFPSDPSIFSTKNKTLILLYIAYRFMQNISIFHGKTARYDVLKIKCVDISHHRYILRRDIE